MPPQPIIFEFFSPNYYLYIYTLTKIQPLHSHFLPSPNQKMGSVETQTKTPSSTNEDDGVYLFAMQLAVASVMPMVMQQAIELKVFEIINQAGPNAHLSPTQIASHLKTQNPEAPIMLDRMLRLLANHSVLTCLFLTNDDGGVERRYGLAPVCKYYIPDEDGVSLAPLMIWTQAEDNVKCWPKLKDAVVDGGIAFEKVHGLGLFEYLGVNKKHGDLFNRAMYIHTSLIMKQIVEVYKGFDEIKVMVDVGGGIGTMSKIIANKYTDIKCINYDLPQVIQSGLSHPGIEHIGGDMFASVPKADAIFTKCIIHDWDDEHCLALLKNCYASLPANGKVIVVDIVLSTGAETENGAKGTAEIDVFMMMQCPGGKERTVKDFEDLAKGAGFGSVNVVCSISNYWLMEFHK